MNKVLLHLEGLAVLALSVYFYNHLDFSWLLFFVLLLTPDLSMFGYAVNNQVGAIIYNLFHTYILAIGFVLIGLILSNSLVLAIGLIWVAHIGMDRTVGYGLKYTTEFKDTHLNRV
ncbi:DUF4260 family protein [Filobacillus milosensis]|uniref:DUF4260 family protein n=1 Tax=Filobacillus milosensis TaxID=94137 RepID=A0A4Y8IMT9_9BACI|nr:DUF4260 domain-containing protein [Filobacillus milosensis]TFB19550.1 DUF4260 family protein [Filobacillus milosensis]